MGLKKIVENGSMIPPFYGVAYYDYPKDERVCYPLVINLFVMLYRDFLCWMKNPRQGIR